MTIHIVGKAGYGWGVDGVVEAEDAGGTSGVYSPPSQPFLEMRVGNFVLSRVQQSNISIPSNSLNTNLHLTPKRDNALQPAGRPLGL